jgi:hypothetical protein
MGESACEETWQYAALGSLELGVWSLKLLALFLKIQKRNEDKENTDREQG